MCFNVFPEWLSHKFVMTSHWEELKCSLVNKLIYTEPKSLLYLNFIKTQEDKLNTKTKFFFFFTPAPFNFRFTLAFLIFSIFLSTHVIFQIYIFLLFFFFHFWPYPIPLAIVPLLFHVFSFWSNFCSHTLSTNFV